MQLIQDALYNPPAPGVAAVSRGVLLLCLTGFPASPGRHATPPSSAGILLNADNFYVGNPAFDTHAPMRNVTREDSLSAPRDAVEVRRARAPASRRWPCPGAAV